MPAAQRKPPLGSTNADSPSDERRPRGRPRREIDLEGVADAVAQLFAQGGLEAVSISATADILSVSRATLYRTVPSKEHLVGILFERSTRELAQTARDVVKRHPDTREQLTELIRLQVDAAIRMRRHMPVFFGGTGLPSDVYQRWHSWSRRYESLWRTTVSKAMNEGVIEPANPVVTTRLLLGMCIWVSRWYRPKEPYQSAEVAEAALRLLRLSAGESA